MSGVKTGQESRREKSGTWKIWVVALELLLPVLAYLCLKNGIETLAGILLLLITFGFILVLDIGKLFERNSTLAQKASTKISTKGSK